MLSRSIKNSLSVGPFISSRLFQRPTILRELIYSQLPENPVIKLGNTFIVLGHPESLEVLARNSEFQLSHTIRNKFLTGDFLLTMEDSHEYQYQKLSLREGFTNPTLRLEERVKNYVQFESNRIAQEAGSNQTPIDLISQFTEPVAAGVVWNFLIGTGSTQPSDAPDWFISALQRLSSLIISHNLNEEKLVKANRSQGPKKRIDEVTAARRLENHIYNRIRNEPPGDDVVSHLIAMDLAEEKIVSSIAGMAVAGVGNISSGIGKALDELLNRPNVLAEVQTLCRDPNLTSNSDLVLKVIHEALRFNPVFPILSRHCVRDTGLELRTGDVIEIPAGASVQVAVFAAMQDSLLFPEPRRYMLNRPLEKYLPFGGGIHRCFGESIANIQLAGLMTELLSSRNIKRSKKAWKPGQLRYSGPYLKHFWLELS